MAAPKKRRDAERELKKKGFEKQPGQQGKGRGRGGRGGRS